MVEEGEGRKVECVQHADGHEEGVRCPYLRFGL